MCIALSVDKQYVVLKAKRYNQGHSLSSVLGYGFDICPEFGETNYEEELHNHTPDSILEIVKEILLEHEI